jgi:hypothetical protein
MLHVGSSHVYLRTDQIPWINTVKETSDFILANTSPDEPILAIPYDAIYCFLTSRPLATPNPSLFGHKGDGIIRQIEQHHVRLILISNRAFHNNESRLLGILGETYGKSLLSYIYQNYELAAQFGPWEQSATVINNHATRIYQRKTPFQGTQK